jgi:hypothetical protein
MNLYIVEQLPIFQINAYSEKLREIIIEKVIKLVFTSIDLKPFIDDCQFNLEPVKWDSSEREQVKAELNAIYALLYKISRSDFEYILDSFNQLRVYEIKKHGVFSTKELSLQSYDKYSKQMELFE